MVKLLIVYKANLEAGYVDPWGCDHESSLELAIENKNLEIAELLLIAGANVDFEDEEGFTSLANAINDNEMDISWTELFLKYGANVNYKDSYGHKIPLLHQMIESSIGLNFLQFDADNPEWQIVLLLLKYGIDVNLINEIDQSCLSIAVEGRFVDMIKILISHGADVNFRCTKFQFANRVSLLHRAVTKSWNEIVQILIESGASLSVQDGFGNKPIETALRRSDVNMFKLISFME